MTSINPITFYLDKYNNNLKKIPKNVDCSTIKYLEAGKEYMACRVYNSFDYCFEIFDCYSKVNGRKNREEKEKN